MTNPFAPDAVAAIVRHMNGDHAAANLLMVRQLAGLPTAEDATLMGLDGDGLDFTARIGEQHVPIRIPFGQPLTERSQVRGEVVRLHAEAERRAG